MMKMLMFDFRDSEKKFFEDRVFTDIDITFYKEPLTENFELLPKELDETDVICVAPSSNLTSDILEKFKNLRTVATRSTGYNHINIKYCIEKNIAVYNVEAYGKTAVAEYTTGLLIALVRNMLPAIFDMKNNKADYAEYEGKVLHNLTIGLIGCGAIGSAMANIAHFFGMKVLVNSYIKNKEIENKCDFVSLEELIKNSDVISLHLPYTEDNYHMIGEKEFQLMKEGVFIINTSRGELIDTELLYENLLNKKVKAAALDVLECEYLSTHPSLQLKALKDSKENCIKNALLTQKLLSMNNVIITPHIAYNTTESVNYILETTFNSIRDNVKGIYNNRVC